jgi:hypothetical protein
VAPPAGNLLARSRRHLRSPGRPSQNPVLQPSCMPMAPSSTPCAARASAGRTAAALAQHAPGYKLPGDMIRQVPSCHYCISRAAWPSGTEMSNFDIATAIPCRMSMP